MRYFNGYLINIHLCSILSCLCRLHIYWLMLFYWGIILAVKWKRTKCRCNEFFTNEFFRKSLKWGFPKNIVQNAFFPKNQGSEYRVEYKLRSWNVRALRPSLKFYGYRQGISSLHSQFEEILLWVIPKKVDVGCGDHRDRIYRGRKGHKNQLCVYV